MAKKIHKHTMIDTIMFFAAGLGTRMRHLTEDRPKCLIPICGKSLLHYNLEFALSYPFKKIVINTHYFAEQIERSIKEFKATHTNIPEIITIFEPELLETGGAIKNAIDILGKNPIFTLNCDVLIKSEDNPLIKMNAKWNPEIMDFLLLLQELDKAVGYTGRGDLELEESGQISRPQITGKYKFMYAGLAIVKPDLIARNPNKIFSLKDYYLDPNKAYGILNQGNWYHASSPEDVEKISDNLCNR